MAGKKSKEELVSVFLRKYRVIRQSCDESILERIKMEEDYYESFDWFCRLMEGKDPDAMIDTMKQANIEVESIIARIDKAIEDYGKMARKEGVASWRQYDALYSIYFSTFHISVKEFSRKYDIKKTMVYRDLKVAETRMFSQLFESGE